MSLLAVLIIQESLGLFKLVFRLAQINMFIVLAGLGELVPKAAATLYSSRGSADLSLGN
jgi:hypothetical protein